MVLYLSWMLCICQRDVALGREFLFVTYILDSVTQAFFLLVLSGPMVRKALFPYMPLPILFYRTQLAGWG